MDKQAAATARSSEVETLNQELFAPRETVLSLCLSGDVSDEKAMDFIASQQKVKVCVRFAISQSAFQHSSNDL